jgi:hypothetical protein
MKDKRIVLAEGALLVLPMVSYWASIIWAARDAAKRDRPGCMVALLVAFAAWPLGLIFWIAFRPPIPTTDERGRPLP